MGTIIKGNVRVADRVTAANLVDYVTYSPPAITATAFSMAGGCLYLEKVVLGPNGMVYGIPANASYPIMSINPATRAVRAIPASSGMVCYSACASTVNGLIYMIDYGGTAVATFDTRTETFTTGVISQGGLSNFRGLVPNIHGKLYAIPSTEDVVGVIDPSNDTWSTFSTGVPASPGFSGGVLAPNGKIYCIPYVGAVVGIIDTVAPSMDVTTITGILGGSTSKYYAGALAPNGKIYCAPRGADRVLIIDPSNDTVSYITAGVPAGTAKYGRATLAPDGKIYAFPLSRTDVMIIDPETDTVDVSTITGLSSTTYKHYDTCLAPNGKIYCACHGTGGICLEVTPGVPKLPILPLLSPYRNCK